MVRWLVDTDSGDWTGSGYDAQYSNLETAMADAYDLVAATESLTIECTSSAGILADTTAVIVDGWTTSVDYTLTIKAHENDYFAGVKDLTKYHIAAGRNNQITISIKNCSLEGVQTSITMGTSGSRSCMFVANDPTDSEIYIKDCYAENTDSLSYGTGIRFDYNSGPTNLAGFVNNCVVSDFDFVGAQGFLEDESDRTVIISNSIAYNCATGFQNPDASGTNHNIAIACTVGFSTSSGDYNVSSDLTAPGINNVQSFDHSTLFPSAATGDFRPAIPYVDALGTTWGAGAIPWQRDVTVDTSQAVDSSPMWTSLASAEAGEQLIGDDLALRNEKMVISCTSGGTTTADTTAVTIDANWLTSETCDFTVQGEADGVWDDSKYTLGADTTYSSPWLTVSISNINLLNFQIQHVYDYTNGADTLSLSLVTSTDTILVDGLVVRDTVTSTGRLVGVNIGDSDPYTIIRNCIFYSIGNGNGNVGSTGITTGAGDPKGEILNNTITGYTYGIEGTDFDMINVSNIVDCLTCFTGTISNPSTNISSDGTAPDNSTSYTVYYEDTDILPVVPEDCVIFKSATDFRLVSHFVEDYTGTMVETNSAIGNGTYLADLSVDNAGKSRQPYDFKGIRTARAFDIGAWQAPAQLTYVVDTDGVSGDYGNLATAFADVQTDCKTDLVTENMLPTISCQATTGVADDTEIIVDGIVVSEDTYVSLIGNSELLIWDDNKYNISIADSALGILDIYLDYTRVSNIQIYHWYAGSSSNRYAIYAQSGYNQLGNLVLKGNGNYLHETNGLSTSGGFLNNVSNCVIYGFGYLGISDSDTTGGSNSFNNITIYNCGIGFSNSASYKTEATANDIIIIGSDTLSFTNTFDPSSTNVITYDGLGSITGLTSDYFTDPANGDFTPVASAGDLTSYSASANSTVTVGAIPYVWEGAVDGVEYTNLATWDVDAVNEAVSGETVRANCSEIEDTTQCILFSYPAGVSIEIIGDNTTGKFDLTKYNLNTSNNIGLWSYHPLLKVQNIQLSSNGDVISFDSTLTTTISALIDNCVFAAPSDNNYAYGLNVASTADGLIEFKNCVSYSTTGSNAGVSVDNTYTGILLCKNLSVAANYLGYYGNANDSLIAMNCIYHDASGSSNMGMYELSPLSSHNVNSESYNEHGDTTSVFSQDFTGDFVSTTDFHTTDSPYELWGANAAYAGAFGDEPYEVGILVDTDAVTVSPISGVNHPSLSNAVSWFQTNRADLVARNEKALISCQASTSVAELGQTISHSLTTSDANRLSIVGDRQYKIIGSVYLRSSNVTVKDFIIDADTGYGVRFEYDNLDNIKLVGNEIYNFDRGIFIIRDSDSYINLQIYNNIIHNGTSSGIHMIGDPSSSIYIFNNTVYKANTLLNAFRAGIRSEKGNIRSINNICVDNHVDFYGTAATENSGSNNIDSDGTGQITDTALNLFVDAAGGDFRLKATATNTTDSFTYSDGVITTVSGGNGVVWGWVSGTDAVVNSNAVTQPTGDSIYKFITEVPGAALQTVSADIIVSDASGTFDQLGIAARVTDTSNFYFAELVFGGVYLWSRVAGVWEELGYYPVTVVEKTYNLKLSISDSAKRVFLDATEVIVSTDNSLTTGDHVGLRLLANNLDASLDNFTVSVQENPAIGGGVDLSHIFTTDITGATRELPWDIGAFLYVAAGGDTLLVLDDALHAHLADQLSLTQLHNLAMQDSAHANVADNLDLLQIHILELIEDANHAHTADELTIIQNQLLAIVDAAQAHTADNLILEQLHNLVVEGSDHAHTAENLVVVQQHLLDLFGANHSHVADNLAVLQQHLVSILSAEHSHTADSIDLIQQHLLTLNSADHAHTADVIALVQQQLLVIFDSLHAHYADLIEFAQGQLLVIASAEHAHAAESLALLQQHLLELFSADHNHTADELAIIQQHLITLSDSTHSHSADSLAIIQQHLLTLSSTVHAQIADSVDLVQQHLLSVVGGDHDHSAENLTLSQIHEIAVNSSLHGHTAGNLTLLLGAIWLAIQDATSAHSADNLTLQQQHLISIAEAVHAHSADSCDVTMAILLAIADALHAHGAEGISLTQEHLLAADSALHSLFSDNLDLTQAHNLDVADALHSLLSDNVGLLQVHGIDIADSLHTLTSDNITLFIQGLGLGIIVDAGIISLTPQKGKLVLTLNRTIETLTADRSVKHI